MQWQTEASSKAKLYGSFQGTFQSFKEPLNLSRIAVSFPKMPKINVFTRTNNDPPKNRYSRLCWAPAPDLQLGDGQFSVFPTSLSDHLAEMIAIFTEDCNWLVQCSRHTHLKFSSFSHASPMLHLRSALQARHTVNDTVQCTHSPAHSIFEGVLCEAYSYI